MSTGKKSLTAIIHQTLREDPSAANLFPPIENDDFLKQLRDNIQQALNLGIIKTRGKDNPPDLVYKL